MDGVSLKLKVGLRLAALGALVGCRQAPLALPVGDGDGGASTTDAAARAPARCPECDPNATCERAGDGVVCTCGPGFRGDGRTCADVDECAQGESPCDPRAA